jgi:branched-chain amino acid transport system permease protein
MLILGGVGRLYGAFIGPLVFIVAQDYLAKQFPEYWNLGIGIMLLIVVLFAKGGLLGLFERWFSPKENQS